MRESVPPPDARRYATSALTPSTSRNCSVSAPGTTCDSQCAPPSVVRAYVPPTPLAQTTCELTGLTACRRFVVPLTCGVSVGAWFFFGGAPRATPATSRAGTPARIQLPTLFVRPCMRLLLDTSKP